MKSRTSLLSKFTPLVHALRNLPMSERVKAINEVRELIHSVSPFATEPVDFVRWVPHDHVQANDYNPNAVAPPEMELLRVSILADGYTQPIVTHKENGEDTLTVVDGFHRNRVGKECRDVGERVHGYLPVVQIRSSQEDKSDRIAATIRHNRARGKHQVQKMSEIVIELKRRNWTDERIAKNLGMDQDEILRLCQISGLADVFSDQEFSRSWDVEGEITESDFVELNDDIGVTPEEAREFRTVNTGDASRVFHTYEKWECYKAGFYATSKEGMTKDQCQAAYRDFLADDAAFSEALERVITEWKHSCEHYLTNTAMNRIAWLGQAAACYALGIPSEFRGGFSLLPQEKQARANEIALVYLNKWLVANGREETTMDEGSPNRQSDIY